MRLFSDPVLTTQPSPNFGVDPQTADPQTAVVHQKVPGGEACPYANPRKDTPQLEG